MTRLALAAVVLLSFLAGAPAFAQCTSPAGTASQTRYDYAAHKMLYCNGSSWVQIPTTATAGLGCSLDGVVVPHGAAFNFFSAQGGANCTTLRQSRTCTNGVLDGNATYQYASCKASCTLDGVTRNHGESYTFYSATMHANCASISQARECNDGTFAGTTTYNKANCAAPAPCTLDGITKAHGEDHTFYNVKISADCAAAGSARTCNNGTFNGSTTHQYSKCGSPRYFVLATYIGTWDAENTGTNRGKMHDANMTCVSELNSKAWLGKSSAVINADTVKAFLCDQYSCNNLEPSATYTFARTQSATAGGATFTTNASRQGPGNATNWSGATVFGGGAWVAMNRGTVSATLWATTPKIGNGHCNSWNDYSEGGTAFSGYVGSTDAQRWDRTATCSGRGGLICVVNSSIDPTCADRGGTPVGNSCWFLGAANESCSTVCTNAGGGYSAITTQMAGSEGQNLHNNCTNVLNTLNAPGSGNATYGVAGAFGCSVTTSNVRQVATGSSTTPTAASATVRRACACNF